MPPFSRQFEVALLVQTQQAIAFHAGNRLRDGGTTLTKTLRDPSAHGRDAFFLELKDRAQIHLGGVNEIAHVVNLP